LLKPVDVPGLFRGGDDYARLFQALFAWQAELRRRIVADIREDQPGIFVHRVAQDLATHRNAFVVLFGGAFDAAAGAVVFSTLLRAVDLVALDPPGVHHGEAVTAAPANHVGLAALAAIESKIFAEQADRHRAAGRKLARQRDGMPELAQQTTHVGIAARRREQRALI